MSLDWASAGIGFVAFPLAWIAVSLFDDWRSRRRWAKEHKESQEQTCCHCHRPKVEHSDHPDPGNPFNSYSACPMMKRWYVDGEDEHRFRSRSSAEKEEVPR